MYRAAPIIIGLLSVGYGTLATIGLIGLDWSDPIQTEGAGLSVLFAACAGFMGIGFLAKPALFPTAPLGRFSFRTFAVAWFMAIIVNFALVTIRVSPAPIRSGWELALALFSWTVVTLIFSIPALIALALSR